MYLFFKNGVGYTRESVQHVKRRLGCDELLDKALIDK